MARQQTLLPIPAGEIKEIPVELIDPSPFQTREGGAGDLVESAGQDGFLIPIRVRPKGDRFQLVFGHRRLAAARELGQATIRAEVVELDDAGAFRSLMVENAKRRDLEPVEEARQFQIAKGLGWSVRQIAQARGCSDSHVRDRLALLEMAPPIIEAVQRKVLTPRQAEALAPVTQLGAAVVEDTLKSIEESKGQVDVERTVEQVFRHRTIRLDDRTPFAWAEICAANGCLGKDPEGNPVCTNPSNYVASVAAVQCEVMSTALAEYREKHGSKDGVTDDLPVYYALQALSPVYRVEIEQPPEFPACPVAVSTSFYGSRGEALVWGEHLQRVADKDGCRKCPAWKGKGPGRALVVVPASSSMYDQRGAQVTLLCMNARCREKKQKEGQTLAEQRATERDRKLAEAQGALGDRALMAARRLAARDRPLVLAALLVRRDGAEVRLAYEYERAMEKLGLKLPAHTDAVQALIELGEEAMLRMLAYRLVESLDAAWDYTGRWMPKKLEKTLTLLFGDGLKEQLAASIEARGK